MYSIQFNIVFAFYVQRFSTHSKYSNNKKNLTSLWDNRVLRTTVPEMLWGIDVIRISYIYIYQDYIHIYIHICITKARCQSEHIIRFILIDIKNFGRR